MQQWQIQAFGVEGLKFVDKPSIAPAAGHVLVGVKAVSLNYRDWMMVSGHYNPKLKTPRVPCSDGAGEVLSVGEGVTQWSTGDRVAGIFMQNWLDGPAAAEKSKGALGGDIDGMLTTEISLPESGLVRIPKHMSFEEAATLPCAALTAWNALFTAADTRPGSTVLIQGTGGVSIFALQLAKLAGARVLGTSSSDEKLARAKALGLDAGFNYRDNPEWDKWAIDETSGEGVDLVVEVGGSGTLPRALKAVRHGGTIAQIGVLSGVAEALDVRPILSKQIKIHGVYVGSRANFLTLNKSLNQSKLKPQIDKVFAFADAPAAFEHMDGASHFGKIVIATN